MGLPPGENIFIYCLVNKTVQSESHMGPTSTRVLVKDGIMYPLIRKSSANCGIGSVAVADNLSICPVYVPTLICEALVLVGTCGADGEILRWVAPESTMPVSLCRRNFRAATLVLVGRVAI